MGLLQWLFTTICVISAVTGQDAVTCPGSITPATCEDVTDSCQNAVCSDYPEAACRVDACNNCSRLFYDEETGTVLKCQDELLQCFSCISLDGTSCGGPGTDEEVVQCPNDNICGVLRAVFVLDIIEIDIFHRGCLPTHTFDSDSPSCYENEEVEEHLVFVFNNDLQVKEGFGCVCTQDLCNDFSLSAATNPDFPPNIIGCIDDVGVWFNPGVFRFDTECDVSFCDNTGQFTCIMEEPEYRCEFDDYSYENGDTFKSGMGDCICNNGDVSCTKRDGPELVCYTSGPTVQVEDKIVGIEICEEDSVCLVGSITQLVFGFALPNHVRGCYKKELFGIDTDCTSSYEDIQDAFPGEDPNSLFSICVCTTSFCNEELGLAEPDAGAKCSYDGDFLDHNFEFDKDECNLCKCNHGTVLCSTHPCNGLLCYKCTEDSFDGIGDCGITICQKGEVCAHVHVLTYLFGASLSVEQDCVKEDEELPLNECITDQSLIEKTKFVQESFPLQLEASLLICNHDLCNSRQPFAETCFSDSISQTSTEAQKVCQYNEETYIPGQTAVIDCKRCTCGGHLDVGSWDCIDVPFLCPSTTPAPLVTAKVPTTTYCTFGTGFPIYQLNENFTSGCGNCICDNGIIRCSKEECPGLVCASTSSEPVFCDDNSFCLLKERIFTVLGISSVVERSCLPRDDWPYNTNTTDDITMLDPSASTGSARVCSESLCNSDEYFSAPPEPCEYNGVNYTHLEEIFPDECNLCFCVGGQLVCTSEPCNGPFCTGYVFDYFSAFLNTPLTRNVTCSFDESCVFAENVTFVEGGIGEATGCLKKTEAPAPGKCTNDTSTIGLMFAGTPSSGSLCSIDDFISTTTSSMKGSTISDQASAKQTSNPRPTSPDKTSTRSMPTRTSKEPSRMSSVSTTILPMKGFCSAQGDVEANVTQGFCECTCKADTNKQLKMSCECMFRVKLTFKNDFSLVFNDIASFEREVITALSEALQITTEDVSNVKISEGSIVVEATIFSTSMSTPANLKRMVEEGSFKITFNGSGYTADSVEISQPKTEDPQTKPLNFHIVIYILAGLLLAFVTVVILFAACSVFRPRYKKPSLETANENHGYYIPPAEYELNEKASLKHEKEPGSLNLQEDKSFSLDPKNNKEHVVSNPYQRSLGLQLDEPVPSDPDNNKEDDVPNPYQRSLDPQLDGLVPSDPDNNNEDAVPNPYQRSLDPQLDGLVPSDPDNNKKHAVPNPYQRFLDLQLDGLVPSDPDNNKEHAVPNPYQRSLDLQLNGPVPSDPDNK